MKKRKTPSIILFLSIGLLLLAGWIHASSTTQQLDLLVDVRDAILKRYVKEPDADKITQGAVRGMIRALDDPFTTFFEPTAYKAFDKQLQGEFSGIGVEYTIDKTLNRMRVVTPLEESPAWRAGVMAGDIVMEIEGQSTEGFGDQQVQQKLLGKPGTSVTIKVRHATGEEQVITITRQQIKIRSVRGFKRDKNNHWQYHIDPENHIGYIKIRQFNQSTEPQLAKVLDQLRSMPLKGLILDLRNNPGGLLSSAVAVADHFLDQGLTIVSVKGRKVQEKTYHAKTPDQLQGIPIVVLANQASASAAEIVAGALTDNQRAKLVGMRTFGKGSVQNISQLGRGLGAIKLTIAYYYLPSGKLIHRQEEAVQWGVDPDDGYFVPMSRKQLLEMRKRQRETDVTRDAPQHVTPDWVIQNIGDLQLAGALKTLLAQCNQGEWLPVGQKGALLLANLIKRENLQHQKELLEQTLDKVNDELTQLDTVGKHPIAVSDRPKRPTTGETPVLPDTQDAPDTPDATETQDALDESKSR